MNSRKSIRVRYGYWRVKLSILRVYVCLRTGSAEEVEDLKAAYLEHDGSIDTIMQHIPHSTFDDEARFIVIISDLIKKGELPSLKTWEKSVKDEKAKLVRKKQSDKEAKEAEELAKDLGVWDEFYGSGKPSAKKAKGKGKASRSRMTYW